MRFKKKNGLQNLVLLLDLFYLLILNLPFLLLLYFVLAFILVFVTILIFYFRSSIVLLSYCLPASVFCLRFFIVFLSYYLPVFISCPGSSAILLDYYVPVLATFAAFFLLCHIFISCCGLLALLLPLFVLGSSFFLRSFSSKKFNQSFLDEPSTRVSTSLAKLFSLILAFGKYNLNNNNNLHNSTNMNKLKQGFDTTFIYSHLLGNNCN